MNNDWAYDIETYPNVFTVSFENVGTGISLCFEISPWVNESKKIIEFVNYLVSKKNRLIGFNNLGFDYPVIHMLMKMGYSDVKTLYDKAQAIIGSQDDENRWAHQVYASDRVIEQIDLFKIHHFDNVAKSTSLKIIEFNMKSDYVMDLPFPFGTELTREQTEILKEYNLHDVSKTVEFYKHSIEMVRFREELTRQYNRDFMNHNDTKIGKDYFIMKLEEANIACYNFGKEGRTPRQTERSSINLKEVILPWIEFEHPEFKRVLEWLKSQTITETKGVFKDLTAIVDGFEFVFGTGGIHGSVNNRIIETNDEMVIVDVDVEAYYPSTAIAQRFKPAHYPDLFCDIYSSLKTERKKFAKGTPQNAMLKLGLNGLYGDSNNKFSVFYDPMMTLQITLNGQLLLCKLCEMLSVITKFKMIQANTDGITCYIPKSNIQQFRDIVEQWENITKLVMEETIYKSMFIRDVNSYIAVKENGKVKRIGTYEYELDWHQNHSALVVPKVAEKVLLEGASIRQTIEQWENKYDFLLRTKVPRSSKLVQECPGQEPVLQQNVTRYYIAKGGGKLFKWMPPLKTNPNWRRIGVESGWGVQVCNDINDWGKLPIDYDYYVREVEKITLGLS